jgi:hypothetical protein
MTTRITRPAAATTPLLLLVGLLIALLGVVAGAAAPASAAPADDIVASTNAARAANGGLGPLARDASLDGVAQRWAERMGAENRMYHNVDAPNQIPGGWGRWGENVAYGYPDGGATVTAWMNSPGHRANILGDFTSIGVGWAVVNGTTWSVQVFGKYGASVPGVQAAPAAPAASPAPAPAPAPAMPSRTATATPSPAATTAPPEPEQTASAEPSAAPVTVTGAPSAAPTATPIPESRGAEPVPSETPIAVAVELVAERVPFAPWWLFAVAVLLASLCWLTIIRIRTLRRRERVARYLA